MSILSIVLGIALICIILWDAFETIVFPRRITRRFRLTNLFYHYTWFLWSGIVCSTPLSRRKETYLSFFGPLSLLLLLIIWATGLIIGFAILQWGTGSALNVPGGTASFVEDLYLSGTTFFTLGLGDITPGSPFARALTAIEAGIGFGFLALVIGYLPALNQSFSRREVNISLLDARAGSPPTAAEMLRRHSHDKGMEALLKLLYEWERWSAEFLEFHLSYPVLAYFRSQHDNQSWLSSLTTILDTSALIKVGVKGICEHQAQLTFAMALHAIIDLSLIFNYPPHKTKHDRLSTEDFEHLCDFLAESGIMLDRGISTYQKLMDLRHMYEPYVYSLSKYFCITPSQWISDRRRKDNWQISEWNSNTEHQVIKTEEEFHDRHF